MMHLAVENLLRIISPTNSHTRHDASAEISPPAGLSLTHILVLDEFDITRHGSNIAGDISDLLGLHADAGLMKPRSSFRGGSTRMDIRLTPSFSQFDGFFSRAQT